jgi:hypothetical protein
MIKNYYIYVLCCRIVCPRILIFYVLIFSYYFYFYKLNNFNFNVFKLDYLYFLWSDNDFYFLLTYYEIIIFKFYNLSLYAFILAFCNDPTALYYYSYY